MFLVSSLRRSHTQEYEPLNYLHTLTLIKFIKSAVSNKNSQIIFHLFSLDKCDHFNFQYERI